MVRVAVVALALLLGLSGCVAASPDSSPSSPPSAAKRSNLALRQKAKSVWGAYFATSTHVLGDSKVEVTDLRPYLTVDEYEYTAKQIASLRDKEIRTIGDVTTRNFIVKTVDVEEGRLVALVCIDNGASRLVNASGKDITPAQREAVGTVRLSFLTESGSLKIDRDTPWTSESAC